MGLICKSTTGFVTFIYNKVYLEDIDESVLRYSIAHFEHLLPTNQNLCITDFINLIEKNYLAIGKTKLCISALERSARRQKFLCKFNYINNGVYVSEERIGYAELWSHVEPALIKQLNTNIYDLEFKSVGSVYRAGRLIGKPQQHRQLRFN